MYGLRDLMEKECARLQKLEKQAKAQLDSLPEGTIRISKSNSKVQYYYSAACNKSRNGKYLRKSEEELAYKISQRRYVEKLLKLIQKRLRQFNSILRDYQDQEVDRIFTHESEIRQKLITPVEKTGDQKFREWMNQEFTPKAFYETDKELYADKGHRVRSKSEKILADYFYRHGIPYHYEKPLYLEGYGIVYPDFTFYSKRCDHEIYWEHEGMMDDPDYVENVIKKTDSYEKNGIYVGERLIVTQETSRMVLKTSEIERKVQRYLRE